MITYTWSNYENKPFTKAERMAGFGLGLVGSFFIPISLTASGSNPAICGCLLPIISIFSILSTSLLLREFQRVTWKMSVLDKSLFGFIMLIGGIIAPVLYIIICAAVKIEGR